MIEELVRYSEWLKKDFEELYLELENGIYILVNMSNNNMKVGFIADGIKNMNEFNDDVDYRKYIKWSEIIPGYISSNKQVDSQKKFVRSNNCYAYIFHIFKENKEGMKLRKILNEGKINDNQLKGYFKEHNFIKVLEQHIKFMRKNILDNSCNKADDCSRCAIVRYLKDNFLNSFYSKFKELFIDEDNKIKYEGFLKNASVFLLVEDEGFNENDLQDRIEKYYEKKLPLKENEREGEYILNPILSQDNDDKIYMRHRTSFFQRNKLILGNDVIKVIDLFKLLHNKKVPSPLPVFIDKEELNKKVITLFRSGKKDSYKKIISFLVKDYKEDIGDYYLLYYQEISSQNGKKIIINDFDFVSSYKFYLDKCYRIINAEFFDLKDEDLKNNGKIENLFDFEDIFDEFLDRKLKKNYFVEKIKSEDNKNDKSNENNTNAETIVNIYKYRKILYDTFYKGKLYLITAKMVKDICLPSVYCEILKGEEGYSYKKAKELLLYYFLLNDIFDKEYKNTGGRKMSSRLKEYYEGLEKLLNNDTDGFENDGQFAFGLGQAIYYILSQSESHNKNHAMIIPFLQKLNNYFLFIEQLKSVFKSYSYKISMNNNKFNKLMSYITGYELENENDFKNLETIILCGYFAKSLLYKKDENNNSNDGEGTNNE